MLKQMEIVENRIVEKPGASSIAIYINPNEDERKYLIDQLHIDEHTLNSALDPNEPARMEIEPDHIALITKRPKRYNPADNFVFQVASVGMFLFKERLIIVLNEDLSLFDGKQFARVESLPEVALKIIYRSIFHFEEHLRVINMCSDELEKEVSTAMENRMLLNLFTLEKSLVYYINAIASNGRVIERIRANAGRIGLSSENMELLDDMAVENAQCYEQARIYSEVLAGMMDARGTVVSNNLNVLMKTLNIIMIILMVPTLWFAAFSMNVPFPGSSHPGMFWFIIFTGFLLTVLVILIAKVKRW